jgi:hypothetical protein
MSAGRRKMFAPLRRAEMMPRTPSPDATPLAADDGETRMSNAWPSGLRTMGCLACNREFASSGRHERMCPSCRRPKS